MSVRVQRDENLIKKWADWQFSRPPLNMMFLKIESSAFIKKAMQTRI